MPDMQATPIVYFCSDLHLSHKPPVARAAEPDWYGAMQRPVLQLKRVASKSKAPIICAGDIFHHWNEPVELVNWAAKTLPKMYSVPGQHDLPYHRYEDIKKSSYYNLCIQGVLHDLIPDWPEVFETETEQELWLWAYPWGIPIKPIKKAKDIINIAVVHDYIWYGEFGYPGADRKQHVDTFAKQLKGYDVAVFGDNHSPFTCETESGCLIVNCGGFMRRNADEVSKKPRYYYLNSDMTIGRKYYNTEHEVFSDAVEAVKSSRSFDVLVQELQNAQGETSLDFDQYVKQYFAKEKVSAEIQQVIQKVLQDAKI